MWITNQFDILAGSQAANQLWSVQPFALDVITNQKVGDGACGFH